MSVVMEPMEAAVERPRPERELQLPASGHPHVAANTVTVDIYDQTYHLRGQDPAYIEKLAAIVDSKMRAVAAGGTTVDSLRVAVLAALNVADEMMRAEARYRSLSGRTADLSGLLDSVLDERIAG